METLTLRAIRINKGWSLEEASVKIGVSKDTLSNWERGETYPTVPQIKRIETVYNIPFSNINFLLNDTDLIGKNE
jgi:transcriptional regulator with XRE-family HTH domain